MQEVWWEHGSAASTAVSGCEIEPHALRAVLKFDTIAAVSTPGLLVYTNHCFQEYLLWKWTSFHTSVVNTHLPSGSAWVEDVTVKTKVIQL